MSTSSNAPKLNPNDKSESQEVLGSKLPKDTLREIGRRYWRRLVGVGPALTVLALALAIFQSYQAIKSEQEVKQIAESVSTQYVNVFPENMPTVIELLQKTQKSLRIVSDIGAYGHFSSPSNSNAYLAELDRLSAPSKKIDIEFICYSRAAADEHLREQFGWKGLLDAFNSDESKAWKKFHDDRVDVFAAYRPWHSNVEPKDMSDLIKQINDATDGLLEKLHSRRGEYSGAQKIYISNTTELPIFMWIVDDKEAIFSFHTYGQNAREHSFRTTDPRFIARLKEIGDETVRRIQTEGNQPKLPTQP